MTSMRVRSILLLPLLLVLASLARAGEPCCAAVTFQAFGAEDVSVQLIEVKRTSPAEITVTWRCQNNNKAAQQISKGGFGWSDGYQLTYDAEVLDMGSRTKFKVAKDTKGVPLAAKHDTVSPTKGIRIMPGKSLETWAKFLAPASVSKVTVILPGASRPWENVAIAP